MKFVKWNCTLKYVVESKEEHVRKINSKPWLPFKMGVSVCFLTNITKTSSHSQSIIKMQENLSKISKYLHFDKMFAWSFHLLEFLGGFIYRATDRLARPELNVQQTVCKSLAMFKLCFWFLTLLIYTWVCVCVCVHSFLVNGWIFWCNQAGLLFQITMWFSSSYILAQCTKNYSAK